MPRRKKQETAAASVNAPFALCKEYTERGKVCNIKAEELWKRRVYGAGIKGDTVAITYPDGMYVLNPDTKVFHLWFRKEDVKSVNKMRSEEPVYGLALYHVTVVLQKETQVITLHPLTPADVAGSL